MGNLSSAKIHQNPSNCYKNSETIWGPKDSRIFQAPKIGPMTLHTDCLLELEIRSIAPK